MVGSEHSTSGAMEALRRVTRYLLGTQNAHVKLRIQNDDPSRKSHSSGHVEADGCPELCGDEQRKGRVLRDVLDCGKTVALENDTGALWIQSEDDPLLRLSGWARQCAESWIGESQGTGSENVMVARGCSRERAADQVDCFEGETSLTRKRKGCRWRG